VRVLVVDDDAHHLRLCVELLERWRGRCEIETSETPFEALSKLSGQAFDVILSDQCMPGMSGTQLLSRARRLQPDTQRVIMSAYTDAVEVLPSIDSGDVHRFVTKPIDPEDLLEDLAPDDVAPRRAGCLVVDSDPARSRAVADQLRAELGYEVEVADRVGDYKVDVVLWLAPDSLDQVEEGVAMMSVRSPETALMVALPPEDVGASIGLVSAGVHEIVWLPLRSEEVALRHQMWKVQRNASNEVARLRGHVSYGSIFPEIVGSSDPMRKVFHQIHRVAPSDASVMLIGETGTGKEMMARAIHALSSRREGPMLAVNLSAIPESLVESELFGHEKGAFTGARTSRSGRLEAVEGGTLFLDEIGDLSLNVQVKLLRVLEQRTFERVGGTRPRRADFRLICATHRDLAAHVADGTFREDLYYRLDVVRIALPPLRERREDIPLLAEYFLARCCDSYGVGNLAISDGAMQTLTRHDWRGNVRELQHMIERAVAMARADSVIEEFQWSRSPRICFRQEVDKALVNNRGLREVLGDIERQMLVQALDMCGGNQVAAAKKLKIPRQTLQNRLKKHEL
jgi:DNA-binding NtrC family response regulator